MGNLVLVTGGARSGKSRFAEYLARKSTNKDKPAAYVATAVAVDDEFKDRIARHCERRGNDFESFEAPTDPAQSLAELFKNHDTILLECLTTLLGNYFHKYGETDGEIKGVAEINAILALMDKDPSAYEQEKCVFENALDSRRIHSLANIFANRERTLFIVTNEVGAGIIPHNEMTRKYRDAQGRLNQRVAAAADAVFNVICGIPHQIK